MTVKRLDLMDTLGHALKERRQVDERDRIPIPRDPRAREVARLDSS